MKRIEVKLAVPIVAPLLDVIKELSGPLREQPVAPMGLEDLDPDLRDAWVADLLQVQGDEVAALLRLFNEDFFREGVVAFDADNAEVILRACAAVRLRLRERALASFGDDLLESGEVDILSLDEASRKAFMCYLFLATIQELIIQHLDESILDG